MARHLILASASAGRLGVLTAAGIGVTVDVSGVAEDDVTGPPAETVAVLARRKAEVVAARRTAAGRGGPGGELVLGCDSLLDVAGVAHGKPASGDAALAGWRALRGTEAVLRTGHCLIDTGTGRRAQGVGSTVVRFGCPTDGELEAYVATGDPLRLAGGFALEGRSAPWIERIEGDPSNVIGCSLPLLRRLLGELGVAVTELWS